MSIVRQAARGLRLAKRPSASWWHFLLASVLVLLSLPVFAVLALALRLWIGPIDVTTTARRLASRDLPGLSFERVRLAWNGWGEGPSAPLGLIVRGVRLDDRSIGRIRVQHAFAALDLPALLHGHVMVERLRAEDGSIDLSRSLGTAPNAGRLDSSELKQIDLTRMAVQAQVRELSCTASIAAMRLAAHRRRASPGVTGRVAVELSCGGPAVALRGEARENAAGDIVWHATTGRFIPARLAAGVPELAPLASLTVPMHLGLDASGSSGFGWLMLPRSLVFSAKLGLGKADGIPIGGGLLRLVLDLPAMADGTLRAALLPSTVALAAGATGGPPPTVALGGRLSRDANMLKVRLTAHMASFDFAGLGQIWPSSWAAGARRWVTTNITAGHGRDLSATVELASANGWRNVHIAGLSGGLDAYGVTLFWLRPIAPLRQMDAHLVLEGPDSLRIEGHHGVELLSGRGAISVGPAVMRITGLSGRTQTARIDTAIDGNIADLLALLARPRLHLLSEHKLPFTDVAGNAIVHLGLSLPLLSSVKASDIPVQANAIVRHVHLGQAVAGRALDAATLAVAASNDGLAVRGLCVIGGMPARLSYAMDFRAGDADQVTEKAQLRGSLDASVLEREGLDGPYRMSGSAQLDVDYAQRRSGAAAIALALDLTKAGIEIAFWDKQPGSDAHVRAAMSLLRGRVEAIDAIRASGDGLTLAGHAEIDQGMPSALVISQFVLGRSEGAGRIAWGARRAAAGRPRSFRVALHGDTLDLSPMLGNAALFKQLAEPSSPTQKGGTAWHADLDFRRVLLGRERLLSGVSLQAEATGERISQAHLVVAGPAPLRATLRPEGSDRRLHAQAPDMGALLAALGFGRRITGGALTLDAGVSDHAGGTRLAGTAKIGRFTVRDAPLAARLARDLSIYGFLLAAPRRQLVITRLKAPFTLQDGKLRLNGARASDAALGVTLRGLVDLRQDRLDLHGTVVPSYLLNALPGKLPGVGKVFSPERGGGLLAATLRITGPLDHPAIRVNPLSLLVPGFLRRLLFD